MLHTSSSGLKMAAPHLPAIGSQQLEIGKEAERERTAKRNPSKAVSFSNVKLGSLLHQQQPGDAYSTPRYSKKPRPLGLIPGKNDRLIALKKLHQLLSPWKPEPMAFTRSTGETALPNIDSVPPIAAPPTLMGLSLFQGRNRQQAEARHKRQMLMAQEASLIYAKNEEPEETARHFSEKDDTSLHYSKARDADPDYMEVTDKAIRKYCDSSYPILASSQHQDKTHNLTNKTEHIPENKPQDKKKMWKR